MALCITGLPRLENEGISMTKAIEGKLREGIESILKFVERLALFGAVIVAGAALAHTPALLSNHLAWKVTVYASIGIAMLGAITAAILLTDDLISLREKKASFVLVMVCWCVLYGIAMWSMGLTAKFSDFQAKRDEAATHTKSFGGCTSVADCSK